MNGSEKLMRMLVGSVEHPGSPSVFTGSAVQVAGGALRLSGLVHPQGSHTTYYFQWGVSSAYGLTSPLGSADGHWEIVQADIADSGLIPGATYHYRLVASNPLGSTVGADRSFTAHASSPLAVATGPATKLGMTTVMLTGEINPSREPATWYFEYGLTTAYGMRTVGGLRPARHLPVPVSEPVRELKPGTPFHYRLVAVRGTHIEYGEDRVFITPALPSPAARLRADLDARSRRTTPAHKPSLTRDLVPSLPRTSADRRHNRFTRPNHARPRDSFSDIGAVSAAPVTSTDGGDVDAAIWLRNAGAQATGEA